MTNSLRLEICGANFTEGEVKPQVRNADVVIGQEISRPRIRAGLPQHRHWFPPQDKHQSISWRPDLFHVTDKGYIRFHRSGRAEHWPFPTPSRGAVWIKGHPVGHPNLRDCFLGFWLLNSWDPIHPDKHTAQRQRIVEELSLPKIEDFITDCHRDEYTVVAEADANSLKAALHLPGMTQVKTHGLDRAWITTGGALKLAGKVTEGPTTGVGNDMRHHAVLFTLATKEN